MFTFNDSPLQELGSPSEGFLKKNIRAKINNNPAFTFNKITLQDPRRTLGDASNPPKKFKNILSGLRQTMFKHYVFHGINILERKCVGYVFMLKIKTLTSCLF